MDQLIQFLAGKKTYLVAITIGILAAAQSLGYHVPHWIYPILGGLGLGSLRSAVAKSGSGSGNDQGN